MSPRQDEWFLLFSSGPLASLPASSLHMVSQNAVPTVLLRRAKNLFGPALREAVSRLLFRVAVILIGVHEPFSHILDVVTPFPFLVLPRMML
jgi:hypothetical protein